MPDEIESSLMTHPLGLPCVMKMSIRTHSIPISNADRSARSQTQSRCLSLMIQCHQLSAGLETYVDWASRRIASTNQHGKCRGKEQSIAHGACVG